MHEDQGHSCAICAAPLQQPNVGGNRSSFKVLVRRDLHILDQQIFLCEAHTLAVLRGLEALGLPLRGLMGLGLWAPPGAVLETCSGCHRTYLDEPLESFEICLESSTEEPTVHDLRWCGGCIEHIGPEAFVERCTRVQRALRADPTAAQYVEILGFLKEGDVATWQPPQLPKRHKSPPKKAARKKPPEKRKSRGARASQSSSRSARGARSSAAT